MTDTTSGIVQTVATPDGPLIIIADERQRVLGSGWSADRHAVWERIHPSIRPLELVEGRAVAADAVAAYYAGELGAIDDVQVAQQGTELQLRGWRALREIPAGAPLNYTEFAEAIGRPGAVRAAASICARNAPALFVPCHRVLRTDGTLGGFAWGLDVKRALLDRESGAA